MRGALANAVAGLSPRVGPAPWSAKSARPHSWSPPAPLIRRQKPPPQGRGLGRLRREWLGRRIFALLASPGAAGSSVVRAAGIIIRVSGLKSLLHHRPHLYWSAPGQRFRASRRRRPWPRFPSPAGTPRPSAMISRKGTLRSRGQPAGRGRPSARPRSPNPRRSVSTSAGAGRSLQPPAPSAKRRSNSPGVRGHGCAPHAGREFGAR